MTTRGEVDPPFRLRIFFWRVLMKHRPIEREGESSSLSLSLIDPDTISLFLCLSFTHSCQFQALPCLYIRMVSQLDLETAIRSKINNVTALVSRLWIFACFLVMTRVPNRGLMNSTGRFRRIRRLWTGEHRWKESL
jgi:hypothetical protein